MLLFFRDLWWGYQHERQLLLNAMESISNVVILSGDRHQVLVTKMKGYDVHEFSASPFAQYLFIFLLLIREKKKDRLSTFFVLLDLLSRFGLLMSDLIFLIKRSIKKYIIYQQMVFLQRPCMV